jgi:hypothetical protein
LLNSKTQKEERKNSQLSRKRYWDGGMAQTVEYLSRKHKALSSNASTTKKKKKI